MMNTLSKLIVCMVIGPMVALSVDAAQGQTLDGQKDGALSYSVAYTSIYQFETDLDNQGSFDVNRNLLSAGITGQPSQRTTAGLELTFNFEAWDFKDRSTIAGATPWDNVHQLGISLPFFYAVNDQWTLGVIPTAQLSGESDAEADDSLIYGGSVVVNHTLSRDLQIGVGLSAFNQLEETLVAPFLMINWQVNDHFRISNPLEAGPAGPAGLEIVYSPSDNWEFAIGGAYRNIRFRLNEDNAVSNGVVENEAAVAFLRLQRKLGTMVILDVYGGALFDGELSIEDANGDPVSSETYDTSPMVALQLSCEF